MSIIVTVSFDVEKASMDELLAKYVVKDIYI